MLSLIKTQNYPLKLIVAAVKNPDQIMDSARLGAQAITISDSVFNEYIANLNETTKILLKFEQDWVSSKKFLA